MKDRVENVKEFYDNFANDYDQNRFSSENQKITDNLSKLIVKDMMHDIRNKKILECGCGTGRFLELFEKNGAEVYGMDVSSNMLKIAGIKINKKKLFIGNVIKIPIENKKFDYVVSFQVLTHIHQFNKPIKEMARVCNDNGTIIFDFRNNLNLRNFLYNLFQYIFRRNNKYFPMFNSIFYIKSIAKRNNLKIIDVRGIRRVKNKKTFTDALELLKSKGILKYFYPTLIVSMKNDLLDSVDN